MLKLILRTQTPTIGVHTHTHVIHEQSDVVWPLEIKCLCWHVQQLITLKCDSLKRTNTHSHRIVLLLVAEMCYLVYRLQHTQLVSSHNWVSKRALLVNHICQQRIFNNHMWRRVRVVSNTCPVNANANAYVKFP